MLNNIRKLLEQNEKVNLHARAAKSDHSSRIKEDNPSSIRTAFQRDRDRILHCKSFRRLKHKTQVFISPEGDHFRTRLTHTLEVSQIARTIAKSLFLNEDLTEAIALGHDLGHTPFGHMGEDVLNKISKNGFKHYIQSLRVVDKLEYDGKGLNLTNEVRDGILKHSKGKGPILPKNIARLPKTLEGQIVRIADLIAYINHDIDDALRAKLLKPGDLPSDSVTILGKTFAKRIDTIVKDVIEQSNKIELKYITISKQIFEQLNILRDFLYERIYLRKNAESEKSRIKNVIMTIYQSLLKNHEQLILPYPESDSVQDRIIDFIAGMSDNYAINFARQIFFPKHSL